MYCMQIDIWSAVGYPEISSAIWNYIIWSTEGKKKIIDIHWTVYNIHTHPLVKCR